MNGPPWRGARRRHSSSASATPQHREPRRVRLGPIVPLGRNHLRIALRQTLLPPPYEVGRFRGHSLHPVGPNGAPCDNRPDMGTVETITIARRTGFCYGVREAIDKTKEG